MPRGSRRHVSRRPAPDAPARRGTGSKRTPPAGDRRRDAGDRTRRSGASPASTTVAELGEFELIDRLTRVLGSTCPPAPEGPGDDASVLKTSSTTLITTDVQEEDVHFRRTWILPQELGFRAMEVNVSDIAAMGGVPAAAILSLIVPPSMPLGALDLLYRGVARSARRNAIVVTGGNIARSGSERFSITVTLTGRPAGRKPLTRSGGQPGDLVVVTGAPGLAGLGLRLVDYGITGAAAGKKRAGARRHAGSAPAKSGARKTSRSASAARARRAPPDLWTPGWDGKCAEPDWRAKLAASSPVARAALRRFLMPEARTGVAAFAAAAGATSMIDVSDGLSADLAHLTDASNTGAALDPGLLPMMRGMDAFCAERGLSAVDLALSGGDDYELLFTVPEEGWSRFREAARQSRIRTPLTIIGRLTRPDEGLTVMERGRARRLNARGHRHF